MPAIFGPSHPGEFASRLALHVLTDREWSRGRDMLSVASAALDGGATVIQLRDKIASTRVLIEEGLALRALTRERGALLIVNDRVDVALLLIARGVEPDRPIAEFTHNRPGRLRIESAGRRRDRQPDLRAAALQAIELNIIRARRDIGDVDGFAVASQPLAVVMLGRGRLGAEAGVEVRVARATADLNDQLAHAGPGGRAHKSRAAAPDTRAVRRRRAPRPPRPGR